MTSALASFLEKRANNIAGMFAKNSRTNQRRTIETLVDGVISDIREGVSREAKKISDDFSELDPTQVARSMTTKILEILAARQQEAQKTTLSEPEEWNSEDFEDHRLLKKFFKKLCAEGGISYALKLIMEGKKMEIDGRMLDLKALIDHVQSHMEEEHVAGVSRMPRTVSYRDTLTKLEERVLGKPTETIALEAKQTFLKSMPVCLFILKFIFTLETLPDLESDDGKKAFMKAVDGLTLTKTLTNRVFLAQSFEVSLGGKKESFTMREFIVAQEIRQFDARNCHYTVSTLVQLICSEFFEFDFQRERTRIKQNGYLKEWMRTHRQPGGIHAELAEHEILTD